MTEEEVVEGEMEALTIFFPTDSQCSLPLAWKSTIVTYPDIASNNIGTITKDKELGPPFSKLPEIMHRFLVETLTGRFSLIPLAIKLYTAKSELA